MGAVNIADMANNTSVNLSILWTATDALAQAKWDAWNKLKGMSTADANAGYVKITEAIMEKLANK